MTSPTPSNTSTPHGQTDEWVEGRRYLGLDILAKSRLRPLPEGPEEVTHSILELSA